MGGRVGITDTLTFWHFWLPGLVVIACVLVTAGRFIYLVICQVWCRFLVPYSSCTHRVHISCDTSCTHYTHHVTCHVTTHVMWLHTSCDTCHVHTHTSCDTHHTTCTHVHLLCSHPAALCWQLNAANEAITKQEKLLDEKQLTVERQKQEIESLNRSVVQKQEEVCM